MTYSIRDIYPVILRDFSAALAVALAAWPGMGTAGNESNRIDNLVQVSVAYQEYDQFHPWQRTRPESRSGYGVVVGHDTVLTTESLVRGSLLVELRKPRSGEKTRAIVALADPQVDLALLRVSWDDPSSVTSVVGLCESLPIDSDVDVAQFDQTSEIQTGHARVLRMAVSSLPFAPYGSLLFNLLCDINVSGTGAPVMYNGRLAGLVVNYEAGTRMASVLPYTAIRQFLDGSSEPAYDGSAAAGFTWTPLIDPAKRAYLNVTIPVRGVLVLTCLPNTGSAASLRPNDVILEWDGFAIDNLGYYTDPDFGRLSFSHLIKGRRKPGDTVQVRLVRERHEITVSVRLDHHSDSDLLVPEDVTGSAVEYIVQGGFVMRELTGRYIRAHGNDWESRADPRLVFLYQVRKQTAEHPGDRVVVISDVLPDAINIGYQDFGGQIVTAVNGKPVRNIAEVFRIAQEENGISRISIRSVGVDLVLDRDALFEADRRLSTTYRIPSLIHSASADDSGR